jgi:hypothetical protein
MAGREIQETEKVLSVGCWVLDDQDLFHHATPKTFSICSVFLILLPERDLQKSNKIKD